MQKFPVTAILENIRSAFNVGAMFRTADGANIEKLWLTGFTPYPPHNRIPKTALGAIESVSWEHSEETKNVISRVAETMPLVAVEITDSAVSYYDFRFPRPVALIFGNEVTGVSEFALEKSSAVVKIPMYGSKTSLNVATSFGIILFDVIRQWQQGSSEK